MSDTLGTFEAFGETFTVAKKPPTLLLAELARTGSGDPESVGVLAEFFEVTLGKDEYRRFKRAAYAVEDDNPADLGEAVAAVLGVAMPDTPTQSS